MNNVTRENYEQISQAKAKTIFESIEGVEFKVLDEEGNNTADATLKFFEGKIDSFVAYQDSVNGYQIHTAREAKNWKLEEK